MQELDPAVFLSKLKDMQPQLQMLLSAIRGCQQHDAEVGSQPINGCTI